MKLRTAYIFTVYSSAPAAQRRSQVKWLTPVKKTENAHVQRVRCFNALWSGSDAAEAAAADHKATPLPPKKNARRAAAAGKKATQRRRRPPDRLRTALPETLGSTIRPKRQKIMVLKFPWRSYRSRYG